MKMNPTVYLDESFNLAELAATCMALSNYISDLNKWAKSESIDSPYYVEMEFAKSAHEKIKRIYLSNGGPAKSVK